MPRSDKDDNRVLRVYLRLDDKMDVMGVKLYGPLDLFSEIGGIGAFLFSVFNSLAKFLTYDFFIARLIMLVFSIQESEHADKEHDHDHNHGHVDAFEDIETQK